MNLFSKISLIVFLIVCISGCADTGSSANQNESQVKTEEAVTPIVESVQFAKVNEKQLTELKGEPESKEDWTYKSPNGQSYKATTWTYDGGNQEFLFIDGAVVRFTFYGTGQTYENGEQALTLFGFTPGPNIKKVADTGSSLRYERVDVSMKVDDFWLTEGSEENSIGEVKITYDSRYFK